MNKLKKIKAVAAMTSFSLMTAVANAAPDFSTLETELTGTATAVTSVVTAGIIAGFGVFALIWGARKIKSGFSSGA